MSVLQRRTFLASTAAGLGLSGLLQSLGPLSAADVTIDRGIARFSSDIEPLVRFLEETPQQSIIEETAKRVKAGLSYRELLAALLLAGVRNVEPRPSVGFKFHAVLVVNSAHLASISGPDEDRWLPIFWAIDNFKSSQARDIREGRSRNRHCPQPVKLKTHSARRWTDGTNRHPMPRSLRWSVTTAPIVCSKCSARMPLVIFAALDIK